MNRSWRSVAARVSLWSLLGLLVLTSAFRMVGGSTTTVVQKAAPMPRLESQAALAWSASFARDYLTWNANDSTEHSDRLARYTDRTDSVEPTRRQRCMQALAESVELVDAKHAYVAVSCSMERAGGSEYLIRLSVPITEAGSGFTVFGDPVFLPKEPSRTAGVLELGEPLDSAVEQSAQEWLASFFQAFARAKTPTDLSGFGCAGKKLRGLGGQLTYVELGEVGLSSEPGGAAAVVDVTLRNVGLRTQQTSTYVLHMRQESGRWCATRILP